MKKFNKVYEENKKLDKIFIDKYSSDQEMCKKNKIELLVEIGELANETRCFKYWSKKKVDMELVGLEYADCFIMCLCFFNYLNLSLDDVSLIPDDNLDTISLFAKLYSLASSFYYSESSDTIKLFFVYLLKLGYKLGFDDSKIIEVCLKKIKKDQERLENEKVR